MSITAHRLSQCISRQRFRSNVSARSPKPQHSSEKARTVDQSRQHISLIVLIVGDRLSLYNIASNDLWCPWGTDERETRSWIVFGVSDTLHERDE